MKHKYFTHLLVGFLLTQASLVSAQSLELQNIPGVTYGDPANWEYEVPLYVKNISADTINVIAAREEENLATDHVSYFCWEECYTPAVTVGAPVKIAPNEVVTLFKSYLQPNNSTGITSIRYSFYNVDNVTDSIQYTFVYDMGVTSTRDELAKLIGQPYPNPAGNNVSVDLQLPANVTPTVEIINVIGRTVKSVTAEPAQAKVSVNTADLAPGVYFIRTLYGTDTIKVQKFTKQ